MGVIGRPFRCKVRFFRDSDREDWIRWYFAEPDAATFPYYHLFNNPAFMDSRIPHWAWAYPGPVPNTLDWDDGVNRDHYLGKAGCMIGTQEQFAKGLLLSDYGPHPVPVCCRRAPLHACLPARITAQLSYTGFPYDPAIWTFAPISCYLDYDWVADQWHGTVDDERNNLHFDLTWTHSPVDELNIFYGYLRSVVSGACERDYTHEFRHVQCHFGQPFDVQYTVIPDPQLCGCNYPYGQYGEIVARLVESPPPTYAASGTIRLGWPAGLLQLGNGKVQLSGAATVKADIVAADGALLLYSGSSWSVTFNQGTGGLVLVAGAADVELVAADAGALDYTYPLTWGAGGYA